MKTSAFAAALLTAAITFPAQADPVHGLWRTAPDDNGNTGIVEITACGNLICGALVEAHDNQQQVVSSPNVGRQIVWDMEPRGSGQYRNGKVWSPDRDRTYNARMELRDDQLAVSGCVLMVCRDSVWTRAH
ncbi:MAG: DUF2147 domain-containing protein [Oceanicaulis sp.]